MKYLDTETGEILDEKPAFLWILWKCARGWGKQWSKDFCSMAWKLYRQKWIFRSCEMKGRFVMKYSEIVAQVDKSVTTLKVNNANLTDEQKQAVYELQDTLHELFVKIQNSKIKLWYINRGWYHERKRKIHTW